MMRYLCCDERRRNAVAGRADLNGIAFLDVIDAAGNPLGPMLTTLVVHFINPAPMPAWTPANIVVTGGASIRGITVIAATIIGPIAGVLDSPALVVTVDRPGDFSIYQLILVAAGFDPILNAIDFSFRAGCDSDFDIALATPCPAPTPQPPPIDYLSRDFNSLVQLLQDRMAVLGAPLPANDPVDLGVTLVELLAYVGDSLSYRQDAVATEATLQNARQRISARRHARLVDYVMHNGCNARAWVVATMKPVASASIGAGVQLLTRVPALQGHAVIAPTDPLYQTALGQGAQVFETLGDPFAFDAAGQPLPVALDSRLDGLRFHTWGGIACCLPKGATSATLIGDVAALLSPGRVLVLQEMLDPLTGDPALANPSHRCAIRVISAIASADPIGGQFLSPPTANPLAVTEIAWGPADALPFPLCISTRSDPDTEAPALDDVSLAWGNVLLADHGLSLAQPEALGTMPAATIDAIAASQPVESITDADIQVTCAGRPMVAVAARFNPILSQAPLTFAVPLMAPAASAAALLQTDPAAARPAIASLVSSDPDGGTTTWANAFPDMIGAEAAALFVVEVDNDLQGQVRFGDGTNGRRPPAGGRFTTRYRIGNGAPGNVGAAAIACLVSTGDAVATVGNPLPATGGADPESIEQVRRRAPAAYRAQQQRAVTPQDYADQAKLLPGIQRAAATLRWTGSWHTHFIAVDRLGGTDVDPIFAAGVAAGLERVRLAGHDLQIVNPMNVGIELSLAVQIHDGFFRSAVRQALLAVLDDAPGGLFDPNGYTFGQSFRLSPVIAAVQSTAGVASVSVGSFQRYRQPATDGTAAGQLAMAANEIPRLDNDPDYPDRGVLRLALAGGR